MKQEAMKISKAQVQQQMKHSQHKDKSKGIFGLIMLAAIAGATYIVVKSDNPFVFLAFMGVMAFIIGGSEDKRENDDFPFPSYVLEADKVGRVPSMFILDKILDEEREIFSN